MTMVERVAKALYDKLDENQGSTVAGDPSDGIAMTTVDGRWDLRDIARAAIEAMRKPTAEMVEEGSYQVHGGIECESGDSRIAAFTYERMISAALKEKE